MIFATGDVLGNPVVIVVLVVATYWWLARKCLNGNPGVKDAAKKALAGKAKALIGKWIK